jgi:hypothetical protein
MFKELRFSTTKVMVIWCNGNLNSPPPPPHSSIVENFTAWKLTTKQGFQKLALPQNAHISKLPQYLQNI